MANLKLVSVRLQASDIEALEEAASHKEYYDRSDFIRAAVSLMAALCKDGRYDKVLSFRPRSGDVIDSFDLTYHREHR